MMRRVLSTALSALAAAMSCPPPGSAGEPFTDPAEAGPDYAAQGEYAGHILLEECLDRPKRAPWELAT